LFSCSSSVFVFWCAIYIRLSRLVNNKRRARKPIHDVHHFNVNKITHKNKVFIKTLSYISLVRPATRRMKKKMDSNKKELCACGAMFGLPPVE